IFFFFFFQAEDGIRDFHVTGVHTCALAISCFGGRVQVEEEGMRVEQVRIEEDQGPPFAEHRRYVASLPQESGLGGGAQSDRAFRSEERRVGKSVDLGGGGTRIKKRRDRV